MLILKVLGPGLTGVGSLILAWRVKPILESLAMAQKGSEVNFLSIGAFLTQRTGALSILTNFDEHVERAQRRGTRLLVTGFLFIAVGSFISAMVAWP